MLNPIIKAEWLKEGRTIRLPLMLILYNAILAFVTILFMFFNAESLQEGYSYNTAPYLYQFLIISSAQIGTIFVTTPFLMWGYYAQDRESRMLSQLAVIPGYARQLVFSRICLIVSVNMLLFVSSLPIISLSCIYSGLGWLKILRLGAMMLLFSFWNGAISVFAFSLCRGGIRGFAQNTAVEGGFLLGTLLIIELIRNISFAASGIDMMTVAASTLCLIFLLLNPAAAYMGYYGNLTGDVGLVSTYCGRIGVDTSGKIFSLLFYKAAGLSCIFMGILFLALAILQLEREQKE